MEPPDVDLLKLESRGVLKSMHRGLLFLEVVKREVRAERWRVRVEEVGYLMLIVIIVV